MQNDFVLICSYTLNRKSLLAKCVISEEKRFFTCSKTFFKANFK